MSLGFSCLLLGTVAGEFFLPWPLMYKIVHKMYKTRLAFGAPGPGVGITGRGL